jgi:hypothetical protein
LDRTACDRRRDEPEIQGQRETEDRSRNGGREVRAAPPFALADVRFSARTTGVGTTCERAQNRVKSRMGPRIFASLVTGM